MSEPYCPDLSTFCDTIRDYAQHGLDFFKAQPSSVQTSARAILSNTIEDNKREIDRKLSQIKHGNQTNICLIPAPEPSGRDFKLAFFQPRFKFLGDGSYECAFVLVFYIEHNGPQTLAVRFESSEGIGVAHDYDHLQMTRRLKFDQVDGAEQIIETRQEMWLPTSYPAFPLGYRHPIHFFAGLTMAVHGYSSAEANRYVKKVITTAMVKGNSPSRARRLALEMDRFFT